MEFNARAVTIQSLTKRLKHSNAIALCASASTLLLVLKIVFGSQTLVMQVPGMPNGAKIERSGMDVGAAQAYAYAVTNTLASVNPSNGDYIKQFVQPFFSPAAYTKVSQAIDDKVATLSHQHELGSYYLVTTGFEEDDQLGRIFVKGQLHTVNAARDTAAPYVFEYPYHFAGYRLVLDDVSSYPGDKAHNSAWLKAQKK